jgi:holo-[acyl-carrier protein] synthase
MEEKVRAIIADFIRIPPQQITDATPIGRSAVGSSILVHRMFARLAAEGLTVANYNSVRVFGDVWPSTANPQSTTASSQPTTPNPQPAAASTRPAQTATNNSAGIGLDIESIDALPKTNDFRTDEFYKQNFTPREMAYCILQPDPYASFAGLFAAKEAIVKAGGPSGERGFNSIEITHNPEGRPLYPGFELSLAHAAGTAVAVALGDSPSRVQTLPETPQPVPPTRTPLVAWLALLLGLAALLIVLMR